MVGEKDLDAYTGAVDYTVRWAKNKYNWNGQWASTRAPISGVMKTGFGGVTNFNYTSKHLGVFGRYDYFDRDFRNTDLGFFSGRTNKTQINGGFYLWAPARPPYLFPPRSPCSALSSAFTWRSTSNAARVSKTSCELVG